jgi:hypothetical protein
VPETYRSSHTGSIADLIRQRGTAGARALAASGDAQANAALQSGAAWGGAIQNIGQGVSGTLADFANEQRMAPQRQIQQHQSDLLARQLSELDTASAQKKIGELAQMVKASGYDPSAAEPVFRAIAKLSPDYEQPLLSSLTQPEMLRNVTDTLIMQTPGYKAPEGFTLGPEQVRYGAGGEEIARGPAKPEPAPQPFTLGPEQVRYAPDGSEIARGPARPEPAAPNVTETQLAMMAEQGNPQAAAALQRLRSLRAPQADREPLIAVMGDDGQPVMLPRSQAVGRRPASNREQGRPVTSGDAGRIAELDTSLDDVEVLRSAVTGNNATGTAALIGTKVPNWVTEITGWGADAKSKNAVIARVKQVIGKALEGGVLRKEDEHKYKDILPTVGDVPSVVTDKINGLGKAIELRRQRELDAREDAGYDVSKFRERKRSTPQADDPVDALIKKYGGGA